MTVYESELTEANLKWGHVYITAFRDKLPADVFGGSTKDQPPQGRLELTYGDLRVETYVPSAEVGSPRNFFQNRSFFRAFFEETKAEAGDLVQFDELTPHRFQLSLRKPSDVVVIDTAFGPEVATAQVARTVATAEEYASYFADRLTDKEAQLLTAHALGGDMSMSELAPFAGFDSFPPVNSIYGHLGRKLAEEFNFVSPLRANGTPVRFAILAEWSGLPGAPDWQEDNLDPSAAHFRSRLHREVIEGLHLADLISDEQVNLALALRRKAMTPTPGRHETQRVFIANFGRSNWAWPVCLERHTVATMTEIGTFGYWQSGDREGFIEEAMKGRTAAGLTPTKAVASRWYNLMTAIAETSGDIWIHREKDQLWWTRSLLEAPIFERQIEPLPDRQDVMVCYKQCEPWRNKTLQGSGLLWTAIHPKAREFLFTEGTLQQLNPNNAEYALALLEGADLKPWHQKAEWQKKVQNSKTKADPLTTMSAIEKSVLAMIYTAKYTTENSNGQMISKTVKNKDLHLSEDELKAIILDLIESQDRRCALSDLPLQFMGLEEDKQMLASLDRIDSERHYEKGNLQVVCRFINKWKSNMPDPEFRRLMNLVQDADHL